MDFKLWTKNDWDSAINGNIQSMIKKYCIPSGNWIDSYEDDSSQSQILMQFVSGKKYDIKLSDWDMDYINEVEMEYGRLSRVIVY